MVLKMYQHGPLAIIYLRYIYGQTSASVTTASRCLGNGDVADRMVFLELNDGVWFYLRASKCDLYKTKIQNSCHNDVVYHKLKHFVFFLFL